MYGELNIQGLHYLHYSNAYVSRGAEGNGNLADWHLAFNSLRAGER